MFRPPLPVLLTLAACGQPPTPPEAPEAPEVVLPFPELAPRRFDGTLEPISVTRSLPAPARLRQARVQARDGFDRLVLDFEDALPGWDLAWQEASPRSCDGEPVAVDSAWLEVRLQPAEGQDLDPVSTGVVGLQLLCARDGEVSLALSAPEPRPVRVLEVPEPAALILDLEHP